MIHIRSLVKQKLHSGYFSLNPAYNVYIHLKDHNKKINPSKNKIKMAFQNPGNIPEGVPESPAYEERLKNRVSRVLEKKLFE